MQALAAIVALFLSIYVPYRLDAKARKRDAEDRRLQARALAIGIYPELLEIEAAIGAVRIKSKNAAGKVIGPGAARGLEAFTIPTPPILGESLDRLYLLGEPAGPTLIQLISVIAQCNRMIELGQQAVAANEELDLQEAVAKLDGHFTAIETLLREAKSEIARLHDGQSNRRTK